MVCPYNRILFSHKKELSTNTCYNVDVQSERSQIQRIILCDSLEMTQNIQTSKIGKSVETESRLVVASGLGRAKWWLLNGLGISF